MLEYSSHADRQRRAVAREVKHMAMLARFVVDELKKAIDRTPLENKGRIKASISYRVYPTHVSIVSEHPAFYLDMGVEPHRMAYVGNKVIPIKLEDVRRPTPKDRRQGVAFRVVHNPQHPGYPALKFVEKAVEAAEYRFADYLIQYVVG